MSKDYEKTLYIGLRATKNWRGVFDLENQTDQEILDFSQSFEATAGPFQGAQVPLSADD